jgi:mannose-1-phosphate guanylyltransferase
MSTIPGFWAVVPAGGAGTRLWPLSRAAHPKFLLDLTGSGRTLLQATVDRLEPLTGDRVVVVTGRGARGCRAGSASRARPSDQVLAEPSPRDSMAAIGLAAAVVERQDPQAVIGSFAADHVIPDTAAFESGDPRGRGGGPRRVISSRSASSRRLPPRASATSGRARPLPGFATALRAVEFVEKPDAVRAAEYVASGEFRWNAGMFVVRAATLLDLLAQWHPELAAGVRAIAASPERLDELWPGLTRIAIDHAVAEPAADAGHVVVVPAPFTWDDVGDFTSLAALLPPVEGAADLRVLGSAEDVTTIDVSGVVVAAGGRRVAVVGLEDIVVVDTPDAVLVTTRSRAQDVKAVVDALKAQGRADLT